MISIRQGTWFTYEDGNGDRRWIEANDTGNSGTSGEIFINSGNDHFRYADANGNIRDVNIGQTASTGSKGEVYVTGKRWAWCPSDNTEHSRRGDRNDSLGLQSLTLTNNTYDNRQDVELNYNPNEVKYYLTQEYIIQRRDTSTVQWSDLATVSGETYFDDTVSPNTEYEYRVREQVTKVDGTKVNTPSLTKTITTADEQDPDFTIDASATYIGSDQWSCDVATTGSGNYSYIWSSSIFGTWDPSRVARAPTFTASNYNGGSFDITVTVTDEDKDQTKTDTVSASS